MKFGDTLWQRSVPQWRNFNIDYHTLKTYIKDATSPNKQYLGTSSDDQRKGKAISIPIPGSKPIIDAPPNLEDTLFGILKKEHDRVGLFVRSKWYEVGSRLGSIERQISQLQRRQVNGSTGPKSQLKLRAKFSKIESDILSVGNELQNLSRFVSINRLAVRKLVKKYQKWTGSSTLDQRVQSQLLNQPESFTKTDLDQALARYTTFLSAVREPFRDQPARGGSSALDPSPIPTQQTAQKSSAALISFFQKSEIDFDAAMTLQCKAETQQKAVYWVLPDNVVELRILLLQHMRYANFATSGVHQGIRDPTTTDQPKVDDQDGKATCAGAIVLDKAKAKSDAGQSPTEVSTPENTPSLAAIARWTTNGDARVCMQPKTTETDPMGIKSIVKLEKDRLLALLPLDPASRRTEISRLTDEELYATSDDDKGNDNVLRGYIQRNADLKPVARIMHKRSRFVGLESSSDLGFWASLDEDVRFTRMSGTERKTSDVYKVSEEIGQRFPHAVLSLRAEGVSPNLLNVLDGSHLTERVENFTLEAHAYAICNDDANKENPPWLSQLATDIRHIPFISVEEEALSQSRTCSRKSSNIEQLTNSSSTKSQTPNLTSTSGTSASVGPVTPETEAFVPPAARAPIEKKSRSELLSERKSERSRRLKERRSQRDLLQLPQIPQGKYWNEYDNPGSEMGGDEGFFVYVDPDAPLFPGQVALVRWSHNVKNFFGRALGKGTDESDVECQGRAEGNPRTLRRQISQLLSVNSEATSSDGEDGVADADDELSHYLRPSSRYPQLSTDQGLKLSINTEAPHYGTFAQPRIPSNQVNLATRTADRSDSKIGTSSLCFTAALLIETAMSILLSTSRRSLRSEVDVAVLIGVVASLTFAAIGIGACSGRRDEYSRLASGPSDSATDIADTVARGAKATIRGVCFVVVCVWAGVLVAMSLI